MVYHEVELTGSTSSQTSLHSFAMNNQENQGKQHGRKH